PQPEWLAQPAVAQEVQRLLLRHRHQLELVERYSRPTSREKRHEGGAAPAHVRDTLERAATLRVSDHPDQCSALEGRCVPPAIGFVLVIVWWRRSLAVP